MASFVDVWARKDGTWRNLPEPVKEMMKIGSNRLYYEWLGIWDENPTRQDLADLNFPVLLFMGSDTIHSMRRVCEIVQAELPDCRYVAIEGAGHMAPFTHFKTALPELIRFLSAIDSDRQTGTV